MKNKLPFLGLLLLCGCASWQRDCNSYSASNFGSDWIVLQYGYDGTPINCWKLTNTAITNETGTDGIYWEAPGGNLVHISGWYNRVQVENSDFAGAAKQLGIDLKSCSEGKYLKPATLSVPPITVTAP